MHSPNISVIVPVYNMAKLMRRALDSLVDQSYQDYEIILINDGSTDESPSICDEYASRYSNVRVIHQPNGGVSSARNAGLAIAQGEWIAFCDPDDLPDKEWLANYDVDHAGNAEIICQGFRADKKVFGPARDLDEVSFEYDGDAEGLTDLLLKYNVIGYIWCKLFRLQIIKENNLRFDTNIKLREDEIFFYFYLAHVRRVICHRKAGYFYFLPDWGRKYEFSFKSDYYLNQQVEKAVSLLLNFGKFQCLRDFFIDSMNYQLMMEFNRDHKREYLQQIRELMIKYPDSTRMSKYLMWIIVHDRTMTISWLALALHMRLKELLKR